MEHITLAELAEQSGGKYDTIWRKARRKFPETEWTKDTIVSAEHIHVLSGKQSGKPARKLSGNSGQLPAKKENQNTLTHPPAPVVTMPPAGQNEWQPEQPGEWMKGQSFLVWILWACMVAQMVHTGGFFYHNSPVDQPFIRIALSIIFALAVDCTALIMTVHRGGWGYLGAFALLHLLMNLTFHQQAHGITFGNALLSFVLALSNFSYTELFSKK